MGRKLHGWLLITLNWLFSPNKPLYPLSGVLCLLLLHGSLQAGTPPPTIQSVAIEPAQCGLPNGRAAIDINFDPLEYNFEWSPNLGTAIDATGSARADLPAGVYTVTIRDKNDPTCFTVYPFAVGHADGPIPTTILPTPANCVAGGTVNLTPNNFDYLWSDGGSGSIRTGLAAGRYQVTLTEPGNPCLNYLDITVTASGFLTVEPMINSAPTCNQANGSVSLMVSGGSGDYDYSWGAATQNGLSAGAYVVTVTDNVSGCFGSATFVLENTVARANVTGDSIVFLTCTGDRNGFNANLVVSFPDPTFVQPAQTRIIDAGGLEYTNGNLGPGFYCNVVTDGNGCSAGSFCFSVVAPSALIATYTVDPVTCSSSGAAQVTVSGGYGDYQFDWADLPGNDNPQNRTGLSPGTYRLDITDREGCVLTVDDIIVADDCSVVSCTPPNVQLNINNSACGANDGQATITIPGANINDYNFVWQPNVSQSNVATNLAPGSYLIGIIDQNDPTCRKDTSLTITENCSTATCDLPVVQSINTVSATCGNSDGKITLNVEGDPADFTYSWLPNVSSSFEQAGIPVGVYEITIARVTDPGCTFTQTVLLTNSDGPQASILSTTPATCQQANGTAVLEPISFQYNWCNGRIGNNVIDLPAGVCNVTVTNPADGCNNVVQVIIDTINILSIDTLVGNFPSCGASNGEVSIEVTGGSNNYRYEWPDGNTQASRSDLASGAYRVTVTDNGVNGCQGEIDFILANDLPGTATAQGLSTEVQVSCPGAKDAGATFTPVFDPGVFVLPPTFRFFDSGGIEQVNGQLGVGDYCLIIYDGNNCVAGGGCFTVSAPSPLELSVLTTDEDCALAGTAQVFVQGGTPGPGGSYIADWSDLPGTDNPVDRSDLSAGTYDLILTDNNGCTVEQLGLEVQDICVACGLPDTQRIVMTVDELSTECFVLESCFDPLMTTFQLAGGAIAGSSVFGDWNIGGDGCLRYRSNMLTGVGVDTVCTVATYNAIQDTTCYIYTIVDQGGLPEVDTIYLDVVSMEAFDTCLSTAQLPGGFNRAETVFGPINNTGILTVGSASNCVRFLADAGVTGDFVDTMSVALCDPTAICDTFIIIVSIAPMPCPIYYLGPDFIQVDACDTMVQLCMEGGDVSSIGALTVTDNGEPYNGVLRGCNIDSSLYYLNLRFDDDENYELIKWGVNGDTLRNVSFSSLQELVTAMNNFDPTGAVWTIDGALLIGGTLGQDYGDLCIENDGTPLPPEPSRILTQANGISVELDTGFHEIILNNSRTLCADTFSVTISCEPPFVLDTFIPVFEGTNALFCIDPLQLDTVTSIRNLCPDDADGNLSWIPLTDVGCIELIGEQLGQDTFCLEFCDSISGNCVVINLLAETLPLVDSSNLTIGLGFTDTFCITTTVFQTGPDTIYNICPASSGTSVNFELDSTNYCVYYTGLSSGTDTACVVVCDQFNQCDTTFLIVEAFPPTPDTVRFDLVVGEMDGFCVDTTELAGGVQGITDFCQSGVGTFTDFFIETDSLCVNFEAIEVGVDTFCLVYCDDSSPSVCDTTILLISVTAVPVEPPVAVDDFDRTPLDNRITVNVLFNDTITGNLLNVILITAPDQGQALINPDFTITYTPDPNICGVTDSFDYVLITSTGVDTATVIIDIDCDQLRIFSGFSPNNDGVNDTWQILGIDDFPNNEVFLFNRWGNQVLARKGYTNATAWDGTWEGKDLPDALYFYIVRDGEGNSFNGYVRLHR